MLIIAELPYTGRIHKKIKSIFPREQIFVFDYSSLAFGPEACGKFLKSDPCLIDLSSKVCIKSQFDSREVILEAKNHEEILLINRFYNSPTALKIEEVLHKCGKTFSVILIDGRFEYSKPSILIKFIINTFRFWFGQRRFPRRVFCSGSIGFWISKIRYPFAHVISKKSSMVSWCAKKNSLFGNKIIYVDEAKGCDSDGDLLGLTFCDDITGFYNSLNKLFDLIENVTGLEVVIAGSPKLQNSGFGNPYNGRSIVFEHGNEFSGCYMLLGHASSCLYQAFIDNIPVLLLGYEKFTDVQISNNQYMSFLFGKRHIDMDSIDEEYVRKEIAEFTLDSILYDLRVRQFFNEKC